jgi:hypothetical protein
MLHGRCIWDCDSTDVSNMHNTPMIGNLPNTVWKRVVHSCIAQHLSSIAFGKLHFGRAPFSKCPCPTNITYFFVVSIFSSFHKAAGVAPKARAYCHHGSGASWREQGGACWEAPDSELRGHFTGHYLSALAMLYASTGSQEAKNRALYMVAELGKAQQHTHSG